MNIVVDASAAFEFLLRTDIGSNRAASIRTFLVSGPISVSRPPITPARPTGRSASAITSISGSSS